MARNKSVTKAAIRNGVGRGKFRIQELAEALGVSYATAYDGLRRLSEEGKVEQVAREKVINEDGEPGRGRPRSLYRLV